MERQHPRILNVRPSDSCFDPIVPYGHHTNTASTVDTASLGPSRIRSRCQFCPHSRSHHSARQARSGSLSRLVSMAQLSSYNVNLTFCRHICLGKDDAPAFRAEFLLAGLIEEGKTHIIEVLNVYFILYVCMCVPECVYICTICM